MSKSNFLKSSNLGKKAENTVIGFFEKNGLVCQKNKSKKKEELSKWDLEIFFENQNIKFEVKYDIMAEKTGNVAIEYFNCRSAKDSGICASDADFWIYVFGLKEDMSFYICNKDKLLAYTKKEEPIRDISNVGDGNACIKLYNKEKLLSSMFTKIDDMETQQFLNLLFDYAKSKTNN